MKNTKAYPATLQNKFGKVKIYKTANRKKWITYTVAYSIDKQRIRQNIADEGEAWARALEILSDMEQLRHDRAALTRDDVYRVKNQTVAPPEKPEPKETILSCISYYIKSMIKAGKSTRHINTVTSHLNIFSRVFASRLPGTITVKELDSFLNSVKNLRYRKNIRTTLHAFWNFMIDRDYSTSTENPVSKTSNQKITQKEVSIYSPEEMDTFLKMANKEILPILILGSFTGMRTAEIQRLRWENIIWDENTIILSSKVTKTGRRRTVLLPDNAKSLLLPLKETSGLIFPCTNPYALTKKLSDRTGIAWLNNGLRHSYISYAMAKERNAAKIAEQCGTSTSMVQQTYKSLTTETEADKWFSLDSTIL